MRLRITSKSFAAISSLALTGCALHINRDIAPPPGYQYVAPREADAHFDYRAAATDVHLEPVETTRTHDIFHLSYTSSGKNGHPQNLVEGQYFRSRDPGATSMETPTLSRTDVAALEQLEATDVATVAGDHTIAIDMRRPLSEARRKAQNQRK